MSSTLARLWRLCTIATAAGSIASCSVNHYSVWVTNTPNGTYEHVAYSMGDTVRLYGSEMYESYSDKFYSPSSDVAPHLYTWSSSTPDKVEVIGPGIFVMKAVGSAAISVRTTHTSSQLLISIIPPAATIALSPRAPTVSVGSKVTVVPIVMDSGGSATTVDLRTNVVQLGLRGNGPFEYPATTPPIVSWELNTFNFTGLRPGTVTLVAMLPVYKRATLKDSVQVTVK